MSDIRRCAYLSALHFCKTTVRQVCVHQHRSRMRAMHCNVEMASLGHRDFQLHYNLGDHCRTCLHRNIRPHVTLPLFSFASERLFSFGQQLGGEGLPCLSQIVAQDEESWSSRLRGAEKSSQTKTRKGSGCWKALPVGGRHWLSTRLTVCELRC